MAEGGPKLSVRLGTSVRMIEKHYGKLLGGAHAGIADRLEAIETMLEDKANGNGAWAEEDV